MAVSCVYTYQDILSIQKSEIDYQLPENVISIIQHLEEQIKQTIQSTAATAASSAATFETQEKPFRKHVNTNIVQNYRKAYHHQPRGLANSGGGLRSSGGGAAAHQPTDENWNVGKSIKITPKLVTEQSDKTINEIRTALNKLSPKNIDTQREIIIKNIQTVIDLEKMQEEAAEEDAETAKSESVEKIAKLIFDIASSNKFLSEIYAQLYKDLTETFAVFKSRLENLFDIYKLSLNNIVYINPNDDYNGYCKYTKTNDSRKALTSFIVNLMKNGVLEAELVFDMTQYMINTVFKYAAEENSTNEVEEITENLYILMNQSDSELNHYSIWSDDIIPKIHQLSKLRKTEGAKYPSMSNRASFKYMDILDALSP